MATRPANGPLSERLLVAASETRALDAIAEFWQRSRAISARSSSSCRVSSARSSRAAPALSSAADSTRVEPPGAASVAGAAGAAGAAGRAAGAACSMAELAAPVASARAPVESPRDRARTRGGRITPRDRGKAAALPPSSRALLAGSPAHSPPAPARCALSIRFGRRSCAARLPSLRAPPPARQHLTPPKLPPPRLPPLNLAMSKSPGPLSTEP